MAHAPEPADAAYAVLEPAAIIRAALAGLLGWIVPGLGHVFIGDRVRGVICLATIVLTFWSGVAIGGIRGTIDPQERSLWFVAQLGAGANAGVAYVIRQGLTPAPSATSAKAATSWVSAEIGVHYTGVAGLLNVLIILDAMARAERRRDAKAPGRRGPPTGAGP